MYLAVLGLRCCVRAFSSCEEWAVLSGGGVWVSHYCSSSRCGLRALGCVDSVAVACGL